MNALRSLHVRVAAPFGGVERYLDHLFRRADPDVYNAALILLGPDAELARRIRDRGQPVHIVPMPRRTAVASARAEIQKRIDIHRPDVIHTYGIRSNFVAGPVARRNRIPWVIRQPNINRFDYDNRWIGWASYLLNCQLLRRADAVHVISQQLHDHLSGIWRPPKRLALIPNGVDTSLFHPAPNRGEVRAALQESLGLPLAGATVGLSMGRLIQLKGYDVLLEAWRRLREHVPDAVLIVLGDGPLKAELESQADRLGLGDAVRFPGFVADTLPYVQSATFYAQSSRTEGVSQTVLEAMAAGLPVVATDVGGTRMIVEPERTGLMVPPEDPGALADAMTAIAIDPGIADEYGKAGREAACTKWSVESMVDAVIELDRSLAEERRS